MNKRRELRLGILALALTAPHYVAHIARGHPEDLLWACNVAAVLVGVGLILGAPALAGVGVLWLCVGLPLWIADMILGGDFLMTSILVHAGVLVVGLFGLRRVGVRPGSWWRAVLALTVLRMVCRRVLAPDAENINCALGVWNDHRRYFHSHDIYLGAVTVVLGAAFVAIELLLRRTLRLRAPAQREGDERQRQRGEREA